MRLAELRGRRPRNLFILSISLVTIILLFSRAGWLNVLVLKTLWLLTARQYGEVALPDARTDQVTGFPPKAGPVVVPVQGGYGACFCRQGTSLISWLSVAVQTNLEFYISHGAETQSKPHGAAYAVQIKRRSQLVVTVQNLT